MRVFCNAIDGRDVEGEVIGGENVDLASGSCSLDDTFTLRCDDGAIHEVHGWLVDVIVLEPQRSYLM